MKFSAFFIVLTSFVLGSFATTPEAVKADMNVVVIQVRALDRAVVDLPTNGATFVQFAALQRSSQDFQLSLLKVTLDFKGLDGSLSIADGKSVLRNLNFFAEVVKHGLNAFVDKKPVFSVLGASGIIKHNLDFLGTQSNDFIDEFISKVPMELNAEARGVKQKVATEFANAIAAY